LTLPSTLVQRSISEWCKKILEGNSLLDLAWQQIFQIWKKSVVKIGLWESMILDQCNVWRRKAICVAGSVGEVRIEMLRFQEEEVNTEEGLAIWRQVRRECRLDPKEKDFFRMWRKNILPELPWIKLCYKCAAVWDSGRHFRKCSWVNNRMIMKFGWYRMQEVWFDLKINDRWKGHVEEVVWLRSIWKEYIKERVTTR
jgi:hypothetical protein